MEPGPAEPAEPAAPGRSLQVAILALGALGTGALSVGLGPDLNWDLLNYHFYNGWAAWHARASTDLAPAQLQSYLNPTLDVGHYLILDAWPPRLSAFAIGAFQGLLVGLLFSVGLSLADVGSPSSRIAFALLGTLAGLGGPLALGQVGSTMADLTLSVPLTAAVLLMLRALSSVEPGRTRAGLVGAGLLLGATAGLKLTFAVGALAAGFATLRRAPGPVYRRSALLRLAGGGAIGFLLAAGPWMLHLQREYGSPLFPFFNRVFGSPYGRPTNFSDPSIRIPDLGEALLHPFAHLRTGRHGSEAPFRSLHLPLASLALGVASALALRPRRAGVRSRPGETWILAFFAAGYALWIHQFAYYRYFLPFEILAPFVVLVGLNRAVAPPSSRLVLYAALCLAMVTYPVRIGNPRGTWTGEGLFGVDVPDGAPAPDSLVLMPGSAPIACLVPFLPRGCRAVRVEGSNLAQIEGAALSARRDRILRDHAGPIWMLADQGEAERFDDAFLRRGLRRVASTRAPVRTTAPLQPVLYQLERIADAPAP